LYTRNAPVYDALQWDGTNTEEVMAFADQWFPSWPGYETYYDEQNVQIVTRAGYIMNPGDWVVTAGLWVSTPYRDGSPEIITDELFQVKYATAP